MKRSQTIINSKIKDRRWISLLLGIAAVCALVLVMSFQQLHANTADSVDQSSDQTSVEPANPESTAPVYYTDGAGTALATAATQANSANGDSADLTMQIKIAISDEVKAILREVTTESPSFKIRFQYDGSWDNNNLNETKETYTDPDGKTYTVFASNKDSYDPTKIKKVRLYTYKPDRTTAKPELTLNGSYPTSSEYIMVPDDDSAIIAGSNSSYTWKQNSAPATQVSAYMLLNGGQLSSEDEAKLKENNWGFDSAVNAWSKKFDDGKSWKDIKGEWNGVAPTKTGYIFDGWDKLDTEKLSLDNANCTAQYTATEYCTVTFYDDNMKTVLGVKTATSGEKVEAIENPTKEGHTFIGWYDAIGKKVDFPLTVISDINVYAQYEPVDCKVSFNSNGGTQIASQTVKYDEKATRPPDPTKTGYIFDAWYSDADLTTKWDFDNDKVTGDMILYAKWNEAPTTIQAYMLLDGGIVTEGAEKLKELKWTEDEDGNWLKSFNAGATWGEIKSDWAEITPDKEYYIFKDWDKADDEILSSDNDKCTAQYTINAYMDLNGGYVANDEDKAKLKALGWSYDDSDPNLWMTKEFKEGTAWKDIKAQWTDIAFEKSGYTFDDWDIPDTDPLGNDNNTCTAKWYESCTVSGQVVESDGTAISGATVSFTDNAPSNVTVTTTTAKDGNYKLTGVPTFQDGTFTVSKANYQTYTKDTKFCGDATWPTITLSPATPTTCTVSGTITDAVTGEAIKDASVAYNSDSKTYETTTNEKGFYNLTGVPTRQSGIFNVTKDGYYEDSNTKVFSEDTTVDVKLQPVPAPTTVTAKMYLFHGNITDDEKTNLKNLDWTEHKAEVIGTYWTKNYNEGTTWGAIKSDWNGITPTLEGSIFSGWSRTDEEKLNDDESSVCEAIWSDVPATTVTVDGLVKDFATGQPLSGVTISFVTEDAANGSFTAATDDNGYYKLSDIPKGVKGHFSASKDGYITQDWYQSFNDDTTMPDINLVQSSSDQGTTPSNAADTGNTQAASSSSTGDNLPLSIALSLVVIGFGALTCGWIKRKNF